MSSLTTSCHTTSSIALQAAKREKERERKREVRSNSSRHRFRSNDPRVEEITRLCHDASLDSVVLNRAWTVRDVFLLENAPKEGL